jgi:choline transport protein
VLIAVDYCVVAFGIILFISTFQWFVDGRKNFTGPRTDMGLEVLEAMKSHEQPEVETRHVKVAGEELGLHTVN